MASRHLSDADIAAELTKQGGVVDFKFRANRKKSVSPSESQIQGWVIKWWATAHAGFGLKEKMLFAVPNGGLRDPRIGAQMKREGLRVGVCDLFLTVKRGGFAGLYVEMKRPDGVLSDAQIEFIADVLAEGYAQKTCYNYDEAVDAITKYLKS